MEPVSAPQERKGDSNAAQPAKPAARGDSNAAQPAKPAARAKQGSLENPEVLENVPGHIIPIIEREFDDFDNEA
jgi:hypothetical protein